MVQPGGELLHHLGQVGHAQGPPDLLVAVLPEGVEVGAETAGEDDGVLRDDGDGGPELGERYSGNVDTILRVSTEI